MLLLSMMIMLVLNQRRGLSYTQTGKRKRRISRSYLRRIHKIRQELVQMQVAKMVLAAAVLYRSRTTSTMSCSRSVNLLTHRGRQRMLESLSLLALAQMAALSKHNLIQTTRTAFAQTMCSSLSSRNRYIWSLVIKICNVEA